MRSMTKVCVVALFVMVGACGSVSPTSPTAAVSPLRNAQLQRYQSQRRGGAVHHLLAITKFRPDVPVPKLLAEGIRCLRWQDIHRALLDAPPLPPVERFIAAAFVDFLEDGDISFPQQLTSKDLQRASEAIRGMHKSRAPDGVAVKQAFHVLHGCTGLLQELAIEVRERIPSLAHFRRFGPAVVLEPLPKGQSANYLVTGYWHGRGEALRSLGWGIGFYISSPRIEWSVWRHKGKQVDEVLYPIKKFVANGHLDEHRLLDSVRDSASKWKIR